MKIYSVYIHSKTLCKKYEYRQIGNISELSPFYMFDRKFSPFHMCDNEEIKQFSFRLQVKKRTVLLSPFHGYNKGDNSQNFTIFQQFCQSK